MTRFYLLLVLWSSSCCAVALQLTVLTEELPPYQYKSSTGLATGYGVELVKAVLKQADLPSTIKIVPWARGYKQALNKKNVILFSMVRTEKRERLFKWVGEVDQLHYYLYKLTSRDDLIVDSIEQARRLRVGVTNLSFEYDKLKSLGFNNLTTGIKYANLIDMLHAKRFDLLFASKGPLEEVLNQTRHDSSSLKSAYKVNEINQKLYIALSQSSDEELLSRLQKAYREVVSSGEKSRLMAQWLE